MAATRTLTANSSSTSALTTYTFAGLSIGATTAGRKVVAVFTARSGSSISLSSCTIGGVAATCTTMVTGTSAIAIAVVDLTSGTTADVVPTWSAAAARCAVAVYAMFGAASNTPSATGSDTTDAFTYSLTCAAGSVVFGAATDAENTTFTSTNLTEDVDSTYFSQGYTMSSAEFATAQTGLTLTLDAAATISGAGGFAVFIAASNSPPFKRPSPRIFARRF